MEKLHKHERVSLRRIAKFDAKELLGTSHPVILNDAVDERFCEDCGEVLGHVIPNFKGLMSAVAVSRASRAVKLNGQDIKFLRKSLRKKAKEFAGDIAISPEQLSRFENDKQVISPVYERLLRAAVYLGHWDEVTRLGLSGQNPFQLEIPSVRPANVSFGFQFSLKFQDIGLERKPNVVEDDPPWTRLEAS